MRAWAALLALSAPLTSALAQGESYHFYFQPAGREPERFYFFFAEPCHQNWKGTAEGCVPWVLRMSRTDVPQYQAPGNKDVLPGTRFYALPICAGRVEWKNNYIGHASGKERNIKVVLICR